MNPDEAVWIDYISALKDFEANPCERTQRIKMAQYEAFVRIYCREKHPIELHS